MNYIIADLEATCWEGNGDVAKMETIEFGAVKLNGDNFEEIGEFSCFVRPITSPKLSDFCIQLTSIRQEDVDSAEYFPTAFKAFMKWTGKEDFKFCTWSTYDLTQLKEDCARHHMAFPVSLTSHIDLRQLFAAKHGVGPFSMDKALKFLKMSLDGTHHRALDDTRNIAKIAIDLFTNQSGTGVYVVSYDSKWPGEFETEKESILGLLKDEIRSIEHVGSTALQGMAAKPTIDLLVGVYMLDVNDNVIKSLESLGYRYFGEYSIPGRHFFRKGKPPTHHIHWVETGSDFWDTQLLFRDYMRAHPADAQKYEKLKKGLAKKYEHDRDKYTLAKTEFIVGINKKAKEWKAGRGD